MVRDAHRRKMAKALGNVIDPLYVINGITLEGLNKKLEDGNLDPDEVKKAKEGQSDKINLDIQRVVGYRQWSNKLWKAIRFAMAKLGDDYIPPVDVVPDTMPFSCQWILSVLNKAILKTVFSLDSFEFSDAATATYSWWQFQLCDVFIEVIKPYFSSNDLEFVSERKFAKDTLWVCLDTGLRLLHPFMPYVTEELWQCLPARSDCVKKESIMICDYPSIVKVWNNDTIVSEMDLVESVVKALRSLLPANERHKRLAGFVFCRSNSMADIIQHRQMEISTLASLSSVMILGENGAAPPGCAVSVVNKAISVYLEFRGSIDAEAECENLKKKMGEIQK